MGVGLITFLKENAILLFLAFWVLLFGSILLTTAAAELLEKLKRSPPCRHGVKSGLFARRICRLCKDEHDLRTVQENAARIREEEERRVAWANEQERRCRIACAKLRTLSYLRIVEARHFEQLILDLYKKRNFDGILTKASGDEGVDIRLWKGDRKLIVQCKRFSAANKVGSPVLRELLGTVVAEGAEAGVLITTSSFTKEATKWFEEKAARQLELVDGVKLIEMIEEVYRDGSLVPEEFAWRATAEEQTPACCPLCGEETKIVRGRYGQFVGHLNWPSRCPWTMATSVATREFRTRRRRRLYRRSRSILP